MLLSLLHKFSAFFPLKIRGGLKIVLPSFPARVARSELHLWLFCQVHPIPVQWDLSALIVPAKTSVEGCAVPLWFWYNSSRVYLYALDHYLAWIQILDPQTVFQMVLYDVVVCCDSWSESVCLSPSANPWLCDLQKNPSLQPSLLHALQLV